MGAALVWPTSAPTPTPPLGGSDPALGFDIDTFAGDPPGLDPLFGQVAGPAAVAQCVARRLMTPRGLLVDAPDVGIDLRDYLSEAITDAVLSQIRSAVVSEALGDERVQNASADVTFDSQATSLRVSVSGTTASGPFQLTLGVSKLTVDLLQVQ